ncbi:MAG: transketolase family protein [Actinomycetia bacterium]|nr:transketolase family protein [Actinomycetes bacterium]
MLIKDIKNTKIESIRDGYGKALAELGDINEKVVVLDADVSSSTKTIYFARKFPDRFFNVGIAEPGMVNTAVGFALEGMIPFANAFASLICYRALEQIRTCVAYNDANVKIISGYSGVSDFKDGPTHHTIFDIAIMRAMPNMTVLVAADSVEAGKMVKAVSEYNGPVYLRLSRADMPVIFDNDHEIIIGKGIKLREGNDLTLICSGTLMYRTLLAADALGKKGIDARVVEIHTIKPFDDEMILNAAKETGAIVTIEEHNIIGGLFSAVSECIVQNKSVPVEPVGIRDAYACTSLNVDSLFDYLGLTVENITAAGEKAIKRKKKANNK